MDHLIFINSVLPNLGSHIDYFCENFLINLKMI